MKQVVFDFRQIKTMADFYAVAIRKLQLPNYFGNNLDALWDSIATDIRVPLHVRFVNISSLQLIEFKKVICIFKDATNEFEGDFSFELNSV